MGYRPVGSNGFDCGGRPAGSDAEWNEAGAVVAAWSDGEVPDGDLGRVETWGGEPDEVYRDVSELLNEDGSM